MVDRERIHEGMAVRCADGEKLGAVIAVGEEHFQVEHGLTADREYLVDFGDVERIDGRHILLARVRSELEPVDENDGGCVPPRGAGDHQIDAEPDHTALPGP